MELYLPKEEELWFKAKMMLDEETMSYNHAYGGTIVFDKEVWGKWYDAWVIYAGKKRFYRYLKENGAFVGEVSYRYEEESDRYICNVIVYAPYRQRGYGKRGLAMLMDVAKDNGISSLWDDIAIDNSSLDMFLKMGFREISRNDACVMVKKDL